MSLNEHVKTIKPHNQGGYAMNGETRVMSEDINRTGYQSAAEEIILDYNCSDTSGSFPQLKGLTQSLISITGQDLYRNTTTGTNSILRHNLH